METSKNIIKCKSKHSYVQMYMVPIYYCFSHPSEWPLLSASRRASGLRQRDTNVGREAPQNLLLFSFILCKKKKLLSNFGRISTQSNRSREKAGTGGLVSRTLVRVPGSLSFGPIVALRSWISHPGPYPPFCPSAVSCARKGDLSIHLLAPDLGRALLAWP